MKRLENKVAVITGGSKGIGKAIAIALALEGCKIVITSRHEHDLDQTADELKRIDANVVAQKSDVRSLQEMKNLAAKVEQEFGPTDILVNNAGIGRFADVIKMSEEDFRATLETNLLGVFFCTKAFLPGMIEHGGGHVVNISSLAGKNSFAGGSAYCASKHALLSFSECLMLEERHHNIKVTTICPGTVQTEFSPATQDKTWALTADDVAKTVVDVVTSSTGSLASLVELRPLRPPKKT
jgi:3-oxoacyl-[acyl-carrier protein] reductase